MWLLRMDGHEDVHGVVDDEVHDDSNKGVVGDMRMISMRRKSWRSSRNLGARPTEAAEEEAKEEEGIAGWEDSYVLSSYYVD